MCAVGRRTLRVLLLISLFTCFTSKSALATRASLPRLTSKDDRGHARVFMAKRPLAYLERTDWIAKTKELEEEDRRNTRTRRRSKILVVCSEFAGIVPNGGIGTFYTALAKALKEDLFEFEVSLLYTQGRKVHSRFREERFRSNSKHDGDEDDADDNDEARGDEFEKWVKYYANEIGVKLIAMPSHRVSGVTYHASGSYAVLDWVLFEQSRTNEEFDVIHFPDWQGVGYYSLLHKKSGLGLKNTLLVVMTHGPLLWAREANMEKIESVEDLEASFLEMKSVELADVVVSPSEYLLDWMSTVAKWKIPENEEGVFVQPYVLPVEAKKAMIEALDVENYIKTKIGGEEKGDDDHRTIDRIGGASSSSSSSSSSIGSKISSWFSSSNKKSKLEKTTGSKVEVVVKVELIEEFVFFGRLETRKGIVVFCDAIDSLLRKIDVKPFRVTFLGSDRNMIDREPSKRFVERRSKPWREKENVVLDVQIFTNRSSAEALRYLLEKGKKRLAVLPSLVENSPLSVFELFGVNAPFIASDAGGLPELIKKKTDTKGNYDEDFNIIFPRNSASALSEKLREIRDNGFIKDAFESAVDVIENEKQWVRFHREIAISHAQAENSSNMILRKRKKIIEESEMARDAVDVHAHNISKGILVVVSARDVDANLVRTLKSITKQKLVTPKTVVVCTSSERNPLFKVDDGDEKMRGYELVIVEKIGASSAVCRNFAFKTAILSREKNGFSEIAFVDAGNVLEPHALRVFQSALFRFDASIVTSFAHVYDGVSELSEDSEIRKLTSAKLRQFQPFLGSAFAVATTRNCFGGPVFMVTLNSLIKHAGLVLFDKSHSDGYDIWEFFARLTLNGAKLEVIPRAMFWNGPAMKGAKYTKDDRAGRFATEKLRARVKRAKSPAEFYVEDGVAEEKTSEL